MGLLVVDDQALMRQDLAALLDFESAFEAIGRVVGSDEAL